MSFEFLLTDKCFLVVLIIGFFMTLWSLRREPVRHSFAIIMQRPIAVSAGIVLLFFLCIGVLDSIHFKSVTSGDENATSLLDKLIAPLGSTYEKTYSKPFALSLFVSETKLVNGLPQQTYPRLRYVPKEIETDAQKVRVITQCLWSVLGISLAITIGLWITIVLIKFGRGDSKAYLPNLTSSAALITFFAMVYLLICGYCLSRTFHVFGTGQIGQDIFYFSIKSIRTGLIIGLLTTLFMMPLALFLGVGAGYFGGVVDDVIQYIYTTLSSIPGVLLITASVLSLQAYMANHPEQFPTLAESADARLLALCLILGVTSWTSLCRLLRAEALKLREVDYVLAARALGSSWFTIIRKHLLPNVMHIVVITLVLDFSFLVMAEAVLSYVGVGVSPMTISWGNMINGARLELARDPVVWWPIFAAFVFMFLLVLAINLFADAVRDAFDPHQSNG